MEINNVKVTKPEVQLEFTVKMTGTQLQQLVDILGCTSVADLLQAGCPEQAARDSYNHYSLFNDLLEDKVRNEVH